MVCFSAPNCSSASEHFCCSTSGLGRPENPGLLMTSVCILFPDVTSRRPSVSSHIGDVPTAVRYLGDFVYKHTEEGKMPEWQASAAWYVFLGSIITVRWQPLSCGWEAHAPESSLMICDAKANALSCPVPATRECLRSGGAAQGKASPTQDTRQQEASNTLHACHLAATARHASGLKVMWCWCAGYENMPSKPSDAAQYHPGTGS